MDTQVSNEHWGQTDPYRTCARASEAATMGKLGAACRAAFNFLMVVERRQRRSMILRSLEVLHSSNTSRYLTNQIEQARRREGDGVQGADKAEANIIQQKDLGV